MVTRRFCAPLLGCLAAIALAASPVRAETPIDPKLYLPAMGEKESLVVMSVNVPAILKLEPVKKALEEKKVEEEMAKSPVNLKLEDFSEVVMVVAGDLANEPTPYVIVRTTKDRTVKEMARESAKLGGPKSIAGYDVYTAKDDDDEGKLNYIARVAPATYLVAPESKEEKVTAYLQNLAKKKAGVYTNELTAAAKEVGKGDIVVLGSLKNMGDEAPEAFAVGISFGDTMKAKAAVKMKDAEQAAKIVESLKEMKDTLPVKIPNFEFAAAGSMVTAKASATAKEIEEMVEQVKKAIPLPF